MRVYNIIRSVYKPKQLSAYVVRILDIGRTLYQSMKKTILPNLIVDQLTLDNQFTPNLDEKVLLIDPALEYLWYSANMQRLSETPFVSHTVRDYVKKYLQKSKDAELAKLNDGEEEGVGKSLLRDAEHTNFWTCIYKDANKRMRLIRDTLTMELKTRADILIPPVPLITSPHLMDVAIDLNEKSRAFAPALSQDKRQCADYFIMKPEILRNEHMMSTLKEYVSTSESQLTFFKFKNLNLCEENRALERSAFKSFLMELSLVSQQFENKAFGLLESGNQTFAAAYSSFAIVSTGFNLDREDRRKNQIDISPFANRYDREQMVMQDHETFLQSVKNNDNTIGCDCKECLDHPIVPDHDFIEYNRRAKEHYLCCRELEMNEIITAIEKQQSQMAFEKFQRSSLKNLIDIIPR